MPVTHFDPYFNEDEELGAPAPCGKLYPVIGSKGTTNWSKVTCKACLRKKKKLQKDYKDVL